MGIRVSAGCVDGLEGAEIRHPLLGSGHLFTWMFEGLGGASFMYPWDALHPAYGRLPDGRFGYDLAPAGNSEHPLLVQVRLEPEDDDRLALEATLINRSGRSYTCCWADMCLMFRFAPAFRGASGPRCLVQTAEGMCSTANHPWSTWEHAWSPAVQAYRMAGRDLPYPYGVVPGLAMWSVSPQAVAGGCIMLERADGAAHVALGWDACANVAHNPDAEHCCIHSDPWFGDVPAGNAVRRRGVLLFGTAGAAALLDDYRAWRQRRREQPE